MSSTFHVHHSYMGGRLRLTASAHKYPKAALTIHAHDKNGEVVDISLFLDNDPLTKALIKAINDAVKAHPAPAEADPETPEGETF